MSAVSRILAIAKGEVGYREGKSGGHYNNHQKYSPEVPGLEWSQNQAWCATFVSWCAMKAGLADLYPRTASCWTGVQWFKQRGRFSEYPAIGAQVFFGSGGGTHTGLVYDYDDTYVYTIEGNTNDSGSAEGNGVYKKKRRRRDAYVYGYGYPAFPEGIQSADPKWASQAPKKKAPAKPVVDLSKLVAAARSNPKAKGQPVTYSGVKTVEAALVREGLLSKSLADGHFGTATVAAYAAWQRRLGYRGKDADGIPGMTSLKKLGTKHGFTVTG